MSEPSAVIYGLDEEYHNIDISEVSDGGTAEFQMMPTQRNPSPSSLTPTPATATVVLSPDDLTFVDSTETNTEQITGSVETATHHHGSELGAIKHRHIPGRTASYLEGKGFGWLLEVEDEEENDKPLL